MTLTLRTELMPKAPAAGIVKHGDRVEIVQRRRRFAKIRAENGAEGWVDGRELLRPDQIDALHELAKVAASLPSMGTAKVWDKLNVHTVPNRHAPSFYQIPVTGKVEVLWQMLSPRVPYDDPGINPPEPKQEVKRKPAEKKSGKLPLPPDPPAPGPPENWIELSKTERLSEEPSADPEPEPSPVPMDDWSLVRTSDGRAGWALTSPLFLAIPDDVAQYAEGRRITSYFSLGEVPDEGTVRHNWLWTTISDRNQPYQFDSFRVFIWNVRRHRFETAYVERNIRGYFPVKLTDVEITEFGQPKPTKGFSLLVEDEDGQLVWKTYSFQWYRVQLVSKAPGKQEDPLAELNEHLAKQNIAAPSEPSFYQKLQARALKIRRRLLGQ